MRKMFGGDVKEADATESLLELISKTNTNEEFVKTIRSKQAVLGKEGFKTLA
jgi:transcription termination factor Rho